MRAGFWRNCRLCWRWLRRAMILAALVVIFALLWFNRRGLPDFLTARIAAELQSHGFNLEFTRMRLSLVRGLVADNVRIGHSQIPGSPSLALAQIQLQLNFDALLRRQLQVDGLVLREGRLLWPVSPTNVLVLDQIQTELRFATNDTWSLDNFHARFAGAQFNLAGEIAHAPEISRWQIFQPQKAARTLAQTNSRAAQSAEFNKFLAALAGIHFNGSPQLSLLVNGDACDIHSFTVHLAMAQARTHIELDGGADDTAANCRWRIHGALEPEFARPILSALNATHALNILTFNEPVFLDATGRGRLDDADTISAAGRVTVTNFMVRGESFGDVTTEFNYKSRVLELLKPLTHTGTQIITADSVTLDFNEQMLYFTNGLGTADPEPIARAIGPKIGRIVEPYHFLSPPTARVNGQIPLHDMSGGHGMEDVDMKFDVISGAPFEWMKLKSANVTGTIHWKAQTLFVTNVAGEFYGGSANGYANFNFQVPHEGADYDFAINVTNSNLHLLAADLSSPTNSLEGALSGQLVVTLADTRDWRTWNGYGHADLRDGLIWDEPIFGILSPVLNAISPGMGSSRATEASAGFTITNGVIYTSSLEIRATMAQLQYFGNLNLDGNVSMRASALLLRNTPLIGQAVSFIFTPFTKLFEYQVTGTLKNPKSQLVYWPSFLMMPLHPIRSFQEMFTPATNAPTKK
jgi:hypothetical protein